MLTLRSCDDKKKAAPFSKEQYEYILADLLKRKERARLGMKRLEDEKARRKANDRDRAFNRLIDSIWREQYAYYKR